MSTADWIRLAITVTAALIAIGAAIDAHRSARRARANLDRATRASRQAWGMLAETQLRNVKRRRP